ncbi:MAG: MBL fold metallo-hydrolase [Syntrophorhabdales bacterium]
MEIDWKPSPDVSVEVSVFGTAYGECILVGMDSDWLIIDSCIDPQTNYPAPLSYLANRGIDPAQHVKQIVASHWHDDHIRGLAATVRACPGAEFVCSAALIPDEFLRLLKAYGRGIFAQSSGVDEFGSVLNILQDRARQRGTKEPPIFATVNRLLHKGELRFGEGKIPYQVWSLSPSDDSILAAKLQFSKLFPLSRQPKKRIMAGRPNHVAVVLLIVMGTLSILLGSDLEEEGPRGWTVLMQQRKVDAVKSRFFKVAHHGSRNGHCDEVWDRMLEPRPIVVLTAYDNAGTQLPTKADVERISSLTDLGYITTRFTHRKIKRDQTVEKTLREAVIDIRRTDLAFGLVRCSVGSSGEWKIDLFGDALPLSKMYAS